MPGGNTIRLTVKMPFVVAPEDTCLPVAILNQASVEIASVPAGGTYNVVQLSAIVDNEDLNTTTVIDTI